MARLLNEWLFTGITASTVLMSICTFDPGHPLARMARHLGYGLALLCIGLGALVVGLRWLRGQGQR